MTYSDHTDEPCIEIEFLTGTRKSFSVAEYEAQLVRARHIARHALPFFELRWTEGAPPVERLTTEWQEPKIEKFRICDWERYDAQMRKLIGLD